MLKYLFSFLIFLTACSQSESAIIDITPSSPVISEYEDNYISNILGPMEIDETQLQEEYMRIKNIFIQLQGSCHGKGFIEYRQCMISEFNTQRKIPGFSSEIDAKIQLLIESIQNEIRYIPYYSDLDAEPMPDRLPHGGWSEQKRFDCNILFATGIVHQNYFDSLGNPTTTIVSLSYFDDFSRLEQVFPRWKHHKEEYKKELSKTYPAHKDDPCDYWTFGPDIGNIVYFIERGNLVYLFIKDSDGAGSGEFYYSIFVYQKGTQQFTQIGNFQSRSGIIPYYAEFYPGHDVSSKNVREYILENYQNRLFLYNVYFWNRQSQIPDTTLDLLEKALQ